MKDGLTLRERRERREAKLREVFWEVVAIGLMYYVLLVQMVDVAEKYANR